AALAAAPALARTAGAGLRPTLIVSLTVARDAGPAHPGDAARRRLSRSADLALVAGYPAGPGVADAGCEASRRKRTGVGGGARSGCRGRVGTLRRSASRDHRRIAAVRVPVAGRRARLGRRSLGCAARRRLSGDDVHPLEPERRARPFHPHTE